VIRDLIELLRMRVGSGERYEEIVSEDEPTAHRLSYPDLDAGEEYAGVIEISSEDSDE
jgi:hypothetical protein